MSDCFVCKQSAEMDAEKSVVVCKCIPPLVYHENCLQSHFLKGNENCLECGAKFSLVVYTQMSFSYQRFFSFTNKIANFGLTLFFIGLSLFACAPSDWINLLMMKQSLYTKLAGSDINSSFVLFPMTNVSKLGGTILDVFYIFFCWVLPILFFFCQFVFLASKDAFYQLQKQFKMYSYRVVILMLTLLFLSVAILLHVFGFFHFLLYYSVGVIKPEIFSLLEPNWATFIAGPAGLILFGAFFAIPLAIIIAIFYVAKYVWKNICCCSVEQRVVSLENKK